MLILAERLREQRRLKSKTQNDLAKTLKISRTAYGEYELGNHLPTVDKLVVLAAALDVSIDYLVGLESKQEIDVIETLDYIVQNITKKNRLLKSVIERIDFVHDNGIVELDIFFK